MADVRSIHAVDSATLTGIVGQALGSVTAEIHDWIVSPVTCVRSEAARVASDTLQCLL